MPAVALVDALNGKAVVAGGDGKIYSLEAKDTGPKEQGRGFHIWMYLQPAMNALAEQDAGEYPFTDLHDSLKTSYAKREALDFFLICLSADFSLDLRTKAITLAEEHLADPVAKAFVLERMLTVPFPKNGSLILEDLPPGGHIGELVRAIKEKWKVT
jgi:hypothetical protein